MDVFVLRNRLITDYGDYIKSFINIADTRIAEYVGQEAHQLNLPDAAQHLLFACRTKADFFYTELQVAIFADGPAHDQPDVASHDAEVGDCLYGAGVTVLRFRYDADWLAICGAHGYVFGRE